MSSDPTEHDVAVALLGRVVKEIAMLSPNGRAYVTGRLLEVLSREDADEFMQQAALLDLPHRG